MMDKSFKRFLLKLTAHLPQTRPLAVSIHFLIMVSSQGHLVNEYPTCKRGGAFVIKNK